MSLIEHLEELRKRIIWSVLAIAIAFFPCWPTTARSSSSWSRRSTRSMPNLKLSFLALTDPFILYFKVAAYAALFVASPFILYQLWAFISPGLYPRARSCSRCPSSSSPRSSSSAAAPSATTSPSRCAASFLLDVGKDLQPVITVDKYFGFLITVILGLGLMFELPVLILLLVADRRRHAGLPDALLAARGGDHLHHRGDHHADPGHREPLHLRRPRDRPLLPGRRRRVPGCTSRKRRKRSWRRRVETRGLLLRTRCSRGPSGGRTSLVR